MILPTTQSQAGEGIRGIDLMDRRLPLTPRLSGADARRLATALKALGHPARVQIAYLLSRGGGRLCVQEIEEQIDLAQATVSRHLKVLRDAGLAACERQGPWVYYAILPQALAQLRTLLEEMEQQSAAAESRPDAIARGSRRK